MSSEQIEREYQTTKKELLEAEGKFNQAVDADEGHEIEFLVGTGQYHFYPPALRSTGRLCFREICIVESVLPDKHLRIRSGNKAPFRCSNLG